MENQTETEKEEHSFLTYLLQSEREYEKFEDLKKIDYILKEYIGLKNMVLKDYENKPEIYFQSKNDDGSYTFRTDRAINFIDNSFTIFRTLKKHIEIKFAVLKSNNQMIQCRPVWAKIAKTPRKFDRIPNKDDTVYASSFVITPPDLDLTKIAGISGKMILENEHKSVCKDPRSTLVFFDKATITPEVSMLKLHKMPIAIKDTATMENFSFEGIKLFDLKHFYEEEHHLKEKSIFYVQKNVISFIYFPIFFKNGKYLLPIGYFYFESQNPDDVKEIIKKYIEIERIFNEKILQTNQKKIDVKQKIINVSEGGFLMEITDEDLITGLQHKTEFSVELVFKKQAPIRFYSKVKHISEGHACFVGAEIIGTSESKKNLDNLRSFLKLIPV